jgi:hypothetical protein
MSVQYRISFLSVQYRISFLSVQYRISFPNGWKRRWRQESKRYLEWSVWDDPERWSGNNESCALYGVYADGSCGLFLSNTGNQVILSFKCWEKGKFTSRCEKQLEHWHQVYIFLSGQEEQPAVLFVSSSFVACCLTSHRRRIAWDIEELPVITQTCLTYSRTSTHPRNHARDIQEFSNNM